MMQLLEVLVGLGALIGAVYMLWRPHWAFVLLITMWPLEQLFQAYLMAFSNHRTWFNYLAGGMAAFAVGFRVFRRHSITSGWGNPVTYFVLLLYILWTVGLLYTISLKTAWINFQQGLPYLGLLLILFPLLILDLAEFRQMLMGLCLVGTLVAILIILNPHSSYYGGRLHMDVGMKAGADRYGSPLALGELGGLMALVAALMRPARATQLIALLRIAAFIFGFGLAIGSGSRGQVLAAGICGVLYYPLARRLANPKQFFLNVIGFGILISGLYFTFRMFVGNQNRARWDVFLMLRDTTGRLNMVMELFHKWIGSPGHWLFGFGPSAYSSISSQGIGYVHNVPAEILCEQGLVGFAFFAIITALMVKYSIGLWRIYKDDPSMRATATVLIAICTYALFLACKQGSITYPAPFFWWVVLAKLYNHEQHKVDALPVDDEWQEAEVEDQERQLESVAAGGEWGVDGEYAVGY